MLTLASLNFAGSGWQLPKFLLLKASIETSVGYCPESERRKGKELSENELSFLKGFADDDIEWFMDCDLLVDKGQIDIEIAGLDVDEKEYEMGDVLFDEETGCRDNYWLDITITCNKEHAVVNLNEYPLLTFLKNKDKDDGSARRAAYDAAVEKDETGLIQREFGYEFKRTEYRYYVSKS